MVVLVVGMVQEARERERCLVVGRLARVPVVRHGAFVVRQRQWRLPPPPPVRRQPEGQGAVLRMLVQQLPVPWGLVDVRRVGFHLSNPCQRIDILLV